MYIETGICYRFTNYPYSLASRIVPQWVCTNLRDVSKCMSSRVKTMMWWVLYNILLEYYSLIVILWWISFWALTLKLSTVFRHNGECWTNIQLWMNCFVHVKSLNIVINRKEPIVLTRAVKLNYMYNQVCVSSSIVLC